MIKIKNHRVIHTLIPNIIILRANTGGLRGIAQMRDDRERQHRHFIRLQNVDYTTNRAYFITICVQHGFDLFGRIIDGRMQLNAAGKMIKGSWLLIESIYKYARAKIHMVMPNHLHGILWLENKRHEEHDGKNDMEILGDIIGRVTSFPTKKYTGRVTKPGWPPFEGRLWQRNFYERIIRDEKELDNVRQYNLDNPAKWETDEYNTKNENIIYCERKRIKE